MGKGARTRLANAAETKAKKEAALKAKAKHKRNSLIAKVVAIVLAVGIVSGVCINRFYFANGTYLRNKTAAKSASATIDAAMMTYLFESTYNNYITYYKNAYGSYYSYFFDIDETESLKKQTYSEEEETTWFDQFLSYTEESLNELLALYDAGKAAGFELTEAQEAVVDKMVENEDISEYSDVVSEKDIRKCMELEAYAGFYKQQLENGENYQYTDEKVQEYFDENYTDYTTVSYLSYSIAYEIPEDEVVTEDTSDDTDESSTDESSAEEDSEASEETSESETESAESTDASAAESSEEESSVVEEDASAVESSAVEEETDASEAETADSSEESSEAAEEDAEASEESSETAETSEETSEDTDGGITAVTEPLVESSEAETDSEEEEVVDPTLSRDEALAYAEQLQACTTEEEFKAAAEEIERAVKPSETDEEVQTAMDGLLTEDASYSESSDAMVWAFDQERTVGENYLADTDADNTSTSGTYTVYYLTKTASKDESKTVDARHILFKIDNYKNANAAKEKAEEILAEFEAGDKTEESFAALAYKYNDDTSSSFTGGLYEDIYEGQMVTAFNDWIFDESRQPGDCEIVTSDYGYHIIYFVGEGDEQWESDVKSDLKDAQYDEDIATLEETYPVTYDEDVLAKLPE